MLAAVAILSYLKKFTSEHAFSRNETTSFLSRSGGVDKNNEGKRQSNTDFT